MTEVYVVGIGMFPYQRAGTTNYIEMGTTATRAALADAGVAWPVIRSAFVSTITLGLGAGWKMLKHLGPSDLEVIQVSNASASGSSAFRRAVADVSSGNVDASLAVGVDVGTMIGLADEQLGYASMTGGAVPPLVIFALESLRYMEKYGASIEDLAGVVVKNSANGALNPWAQRRKPVSLEDVLNGAPIAHPLTGRHVCPVGEGAAAVIVMSGEAVKRHGIPRERCIKVSGSVSTVDSLGTLDDFDVSRLTRQAADALYEQSGIGPQELDLVELHEAFSVEEFLHTEAMGLYGEGEGPARLREGYTAIGGTTAVNASGGLLAMGHPFGPTGLGQVAEIVRQLRGEADGRQHPNARTGVAHMVGVGEVCVMHMLEK